MPADAEPAPKKSVDEVWRQLNSKAGTATTSTKAFNKLWFSFSNDVPGASCPKASTAVKAQAYHLPAAQACLRSSAPTTKSDTMSADSKQQHQQRQDQGQQLLETSTAPTAALVPASQLHGAALERCVQALQASAAGDRRAALLQIQGMLLAEHTSSTEVATALQAQLGKGLLRRFDDASGAVRELAVSLFLQLLRKGDGAVLQLLPYAMPVLEERLQTSEDGRGSPVEGSEEVRLLLTQLHTHLIAAAGQAIAAYAPEAVEMLKWCCDDGYHEVNMEACAGVVELDGILGMRLHNVSKGLVAALLPLTTHKRYKVRVAAIRALTPIMHQGAHEMILEMVAWRDPNSVPIAAFYGGDLKVNFCGKLATDPHAQVRLEFLHMLGNWLTTLRERLDHEPRLLPYVLSALCDESAAVVEAALQLLDSLGAQYEREHEKELREAVTYLPDGAQALGWAEDSGNSGHRCRIVYAGAQTAAAALGGHHAGKTVAAAESVQTVAGDVAATAAAREAPALTPGAIDVATGPNTATTCGSSSTGTAQFILPGPFRSRPRLGTRILAQSNFGRLVGALVAEVGSWQSEPRRRAAQLLLVNLVLVEEGVELHLQTLLPALAKTIRDPSVRDAIEQCCAIVGCFARTGDAVALLAPRIEDVSADFNTRADALLALGHLIRGAAAKGSMAPHVASVLSLLELPAVAHSEDKHMRAAVAEVALQLLGACQAGSCLADAEQVRLLKVLLRLADSDSSSSSSSSIGGSISGMRMTGSEVQTAQSEVLLATMADVLACGVGGVDELMARHREALLLQMDVDNVSLYDSQDIGVICRALVPTCYAGALASGSLVATAARTEPTTSPSAPATTTQAAVSQPSDGSKCDDSGKASSSAGSDGTSGLFWRPGDLAPLLRLLQRSMACSSSSSALTTPAAAKALRLLLGCFDICLSSWPAAALDSECLERVMCETLPLLLRSGRAAAQLTALSALRTLLARGLLAGPGEAGSNQQQQQQRCQEGLLALGWQAFGTDLCTLAPASAGAIEAVRLQAVQVIQDIVYRMGAGVILTDSRPSSAEGPGKPVSTTLPAAALQQMPQPVAALLMALDDASDAVRCAALGTLTQLLHALLSASTTDGNMTSSRSSACSSYRQLVEAAVQQALLHQDMGTVEFAQKMRALSAWAEAAQLKLPATAQEGLLDTSYETAQ